MTAAAPLHDEDDRWRAVRERDHTADGRFVYAVTSTGIFCRPSCASRRPLRARVRFFDTTRDAQDAGFRACLRCRPLDTSSADPWIARIDRACRLIARAQQPLTLEVLARRVNSSPYHFLRNFRRMVGVTPREFSEARRFESVRQQLRSEADVTTAVVGAGYGSSSRFYERAAPRLAMRPSDYHTGAPGQSIRFATAPSPLGRVLVATTAKGVCAVSIGDDDDALVRALHDEFPRATLTPGDADTRRSIAAVVDHLRGRMPALDLPLDIRATAFQWLVWSELRRIPPGETRTYGDVAASIGRPEAARAVARACAANPVALAVPCHRVVPAAGGVGGYRWGAERKAKLLDSERNR